MRIEAVAEAIRRVKSERCRGVSRMEVRDWSSGEGKGGAGGPRKTREVREHSRCIENETKVENWVEICGSGLGVEES